MGNKDSIIWSILHIIRKCKWKQVIPLHFHSNDPNLALTVPREKVDHPWPTAMLVAGGNAKGCNYFWREFGGFS